MFKQTCPEPGCGRVFEHEKEVVAKRSLGVHRHHAHGYQGDRDYRRELSAEDKKHRKALVAASWWTVGSDIPIKLSECPCCGAKFIALKAKPQ
jgi:hypothetical protein